MNLFCKWSVLIYSSIFINYSSFSSFLKEDQSENMKSAQTISNLDSDDIRQIMTVELAKQTISIFNKFLDPDQFLNSSENQENLTQQASKIVKPDAESAPLMEKIEKLMGPILFSSPFLKSSDQKTIHDLIARTALLLRPEYFSSLTKDKDEVSEVTENILEKFLQEWLQKGAFDKLLKMAQQEFEKDQTTTQAQRKALPNVIQYFSKLMRSMVSDENDDPVNKHVTQPDFLRIKELSEWLEDEKHHNNENYDRNQQEFENLEKKIRDQRNQATKETTTVLFNFLKEMIPDFKKMTHISQIQDFHKEKAVTRKRQEFENYISTVSNHSEFSKIFEPNFLRRFRYNIDQHQYGKIFIEIVGESFEKQHQNHHIHQIVQQIWYALQLDTIHNHPQDAMSRMPKTSQQGKEAPNFGYKMGEAEWYKKWARTLWVQASGDIIVDAFHDAVDLGHNLNKKLFLERFKLYIHRNDSKNCKKKYYSHHCPYDAFMKSFEKYLIDFVINKTTNSNSKNIITLFENEENLLTQAFDKLGQFKDFANDMVELYPCPKTMKSKSKDNQSKDLVLGIGFSGDLFESPNPCGKKSNEIWITFSQSGRHFGGHLLLSFVEQLAHYKFNHYQRISFEQAEILFKKYQNLISYYINQQIKGKYEYPASFWNSSLLRWIKTSNAQLEGFISQLEQNLSFKDLDPALQIWIQNTKNWYHIPVNIKIRLCPEISLIQQKIHKQSRELLFDAVSKYPFFNLDQYKNKFFLINLLYEHWKDEILQRCLNKNIQPLSEDQIQRQDFSIEFQRDILQALQETINQVHPYLQQIWHPSLDIEFQNFMKQQPQIQNLENDLTKIKKEIQKREKTLKKLEIIEKTFEKKQKLTLETKSIKNSHKNPEDSKKENRERLENLKTKYEELKKKKENLPKNIEDLSLQDYERFRKHFFKNRHVHQCIEPLLANVLGHDHFFSVFISPKTRAPIKDLNSILIQLGNTIPHYIIEPCENKCQYHALGHLYIGDMLSYQSLDRLNEMRQASNLEGVPNQLMSLN